MPKFTKPYWVDWQDQTKNDDGWGVTQERPTVPRTTIREMEVPEDLRVEAQRLQGQQGGSGRTQQGPAQRPQQRMPQHGPPGQRADDPRATIIDHAVPDNAIPAQGVIISGETQGASMGEDTRALVVRGAQGGAALAHPSEPPNVVVAAHDFRPELATDARLVLVREPDEEQAAAFRVLRHQIVQQGSPQVIVVSSATPGEGKTTTAVNLSLALAECGRAKVLLVEGNFRRPRLAHVFRFEPPWCFAQQIAEHKREPMERWSVVELAPHGLHVAAVDPRAAQRPLLDAPAFNFAMERLRAAGYDHIVIDGPSVLGSAEVNLLQDAADGVLLVCRGKRSHRKQLRACIEQLAPGSILGVTLLEE